MTELNKTEHDRTEHDKHIREHSMTEQSMTEQSMTYQKNIPDQNVKILFGGRKPNVLCETCRPQPLADASMTYLVGFAALRHSMGPLQMPCNCRCLICPEASWWGGAPPESSLAGAACFWTNMRAIGACQRASTPCYFALCRAGWAGRPRRQQQETPTVGLEPTTTRLRALRSTD